MHKSKSSFALSLVNCALCILVSACVGSTKPTIKIGLIGPFEGRYREVGQEVIYAVRLAVRQANASGGVGGYTVELMAFDDGGDPEQAAEQARKLSTDPQVMGVIGNWLDATTLAAAPVLAQSGIPFLATAAAPDLDPAAFRMWPTESALRAAVPTALYCESDCSSLETLDWFAAHCQPATTPCVGPPLWGLNQFPRLVDSTAEGVWVAAPAPLPADSGDPGFTAEYSQISQGVAPRFLAVLAYDATRVLFDAINRDARSHPAPTRAGVAEALAQTHFTGLSGPITFDAARQWAEAKGTPYRWRNGQLTPP